MPLDYYQHSAVRTIAATSPGVFADDPGVDGDPADIAALACSMLNRTQPRVKLRVIFRDSDGAEVPGTFTARGFVVVPSETAGGQPSIEDHDGVTDYASSKHLTFDEIGLNDTFGLLLSDITAAGAVRAVIRAEEID